MVEKTFAQRLSAWRKYKGFRSMAAAARADNVPYRTWQDWEGSERTPTGFALAMWEARFSEMEKQQQQEQTGEQNK
jgi:hypothetical protein